jgi:hypothetical protein
MSDNNLGPREPNNDMVICPNCTCQFRAIPVNVQKEAAEARAELRKLQERGGLVYAPYAACDDERRLLREQLAEARAALRDAEFHIAEWSPTVHAEAWVIEHAAALKAAREAK